MEELMLRIDNVSKQYKLGQIGGTTLRDELQRLSAKLRGKEDPTRCIGAKNYNKGETFMALNGVSFDVKKGERVGIIGHNGAGKSTLLKLISRVTAPTGGSIGLNGRVASMLEVGTGFHGELTGRENIYMNGAILGMTKKEIDAKMEDIIEFSECRQFIDTPVKRYSSGMYVKLAFSVAAHLDSEIMIMDEVLAVGDMAFQKKCLDKMSDVSKTEGRTILYVSHNMNTIRQLCDRVIVLDHGKVVYDGEVEDGIGMYMGKYLSGNPVNNCDIIPREPIGDHGMNVTSIELLGTDDCVIWDDAPLKLYVVYYASKDYSKIAMRIILFNNFHIPIGMGASTAVISSKTGKNTISCTVAMPKLSEGQYTARFVLYEISEFGNELIHDVVEPAFGFQKSIRVTENNTSKRWNQSVWGNIVFPTITVD